LVLCVWLFLASLLLFSGMLTEILHPPPISISIAAAEEVDEDAPAVAVPIAMSIAVEVTWFISILNIFLGGRNSRTMNLVEKCH